VLAGSVIEALAPRDGGVYVDATFGAGGHTRAILAAADCRVIAFDRDQSAIARGASLVEAMGGRLTLVEDAFSSLGDVVTTMAPDGVDGVLIDLGVSSMQLDTAERGFSFRLDGPLDMRMSGEGVSAADIVNAAGERDLATIIYILGEERFSRQVARAIVKARAEARIETTRRLADIVASAVRTKPNDIHPATRTFQALRIFVNDELGELAAALIAAENILKPGGRLAVVSFHSLEDRIVKNFLSARGKRSGGSRHLPDVEQEAPSFEILTKRPVTPGHDEVVANPRARSAKLRAAQRTDAPAQSDNETFNWPSLAAVMRGG
jgi:16S rRNA (cytosine1402-N4)-methyltransferase